MRDKNYGYGITFVDIDETLFHTTAKIIVKKEGEAIKKLSNQEFNSYELQKGETFDFCEFIDSEIFYNNSVPITPIINQVKHILKRIKQTDSKSRVILLTAREDFNDKELFLQTFREQGIDIDNQELIYVERAGNIKGMTVAKKKRRVILNYLKTGLYRRCRLIDDCQKNLDEFLTLKTTLPKNIKEKVRQQYTLSDDETEIHFYGLQVKESGKLEPVK